MRFFTVIVYDAYEKDITWHDTLEKANEYLEKMGAKGEYGTDYFIAVIVEREYKLPALTVVAK